MKDDCNRANSQAIEQLNVNLGTILHSSQHHLFRPGERCNYMQSPYLLNLSPSAVRTFSDVVYIFASPFAKLETWLFG